MASALATESAQATRLAQATRRSATAWWLWLAGGLAVAGALTLWSILTGNGQMSLADVLTGHASARDWQVLWVSRVPRTAAIILSGSAMAVAGLVMQMLVQNRYVEPSTTGVTESAGLGVLIITIVAPGTPVVVKMIFAIVFAMLGTALLITLVRALPYRDTIVVPLLGIVLSGILGAAATFLAWQFRLQATLQAWATGDFSGIIRGRYELLWIVGAVAVITYLFADVFTVAGLGKDIASNLGLNHKRITAIGLAIVAVVAGITTVVAGMLPFLGLVVPNLVSLIVGDYMRRSLPLVAIGGAIFVLIGDIFGRIIVAPAEVPVGIVMGIIGAIVFIGFLLRTSRSGQHQR